MICKLCNDHGFTTSPITGIAERCPCKRGLVVHVMTFKPGLVAGFFCSVCDPYSRANKPRGLEPGSFVVFTRQAWLPEGERTHWDPTKRGQKDRAATEPEQRAICNQCCTGFAQLLGMWAQGRPAEIAIGAPHMNEGGRLVIA
jgi:hypothetical protein